MPLQAKANGLQLCEVPPEVSGLNTLVDFPACAFHENGCIAIW